VTRKIVEAHGGRLTVESVAGTGTTGGGAVAGIRRDIVLIRKNFYFFRLDASWKWYVKHALKPVSDAGRYCWGRQ